MATNDGSTGPFSNKRALVTGATSGIGRATALGLARGGATVFATGRRGDRLDELATEVDRAGAIRPLVFDVRDREACAAALTRDVLEDLDILVNNAGLAAGVGTLQGGDVDDWERMIDTNVKGLLYVTRTVLPGMVRRGRGDVVNVGSVSGRWVYPGGSVYCATKYAVNALTEAARLDVMGTGVRVMNVEPGMVDTEFSLVRLGDPERAAKVYEGLVPLSADDVAETILWMLSRPAHVTLQEVVVFPTAQAGVGPGKLHRGEG